MGKVSGGTSTGGTVRLEGNDFRYDYVDMWQKTFTNPKPNGEVFVYKSPDNIAMASTGHLVQVRSASAQSASKDSGSGIGEMLSDWKSKFGELKDFLIGVVTVISAAALAVAAVILSTASDDRTDEDQKEAKTVEVNTQKNLKEIVATVVKFDINKYINEKAQSALFGKTFEELSKSAEKGELSGAREKIGNLVGKVVNYDLHDTLHNSVQRLLFKGKTIEEIVKEDTTKHYDYNEATKRIETTVTVNKSNHPLAHLINDIVKFNIFDQINEALQARIFGKTFDQILYDYEKTMEHFENNKSNKGAEDKATAEEMTEQKANIANPDEQNQQNSENTNRNTTENTRDLASIDLNSNQSDNSTNNYSQSFNKNM